MSGRQRWMEGMVEEYTPKTVEKRHMRDDETNLILD